MSEIGYKKIVIKIGSNVLTREGGLLNLDRLKSIVDEIANLRKNNVQVVVVSSGAVASGRGLVKLPDKIEIVSRRQVLSSIGQAKLISHYTELFKEHSTLCAQVLVTKEDFRDRRHYLNMKNCLTTLLDNNIVPIINENDVISVTELMFTDNDELAGLLASMLNVEKLFILSNVNGIYNGDYKDPKSEVIPFIEYETENLKEFISNEQSTLGRGGMIAKCAIARKVAGLGIPVQIANGKTANVITDLASNKSMGTTFLPKQIASNKKKWVAHSEGFVKGKVIVDDGAKKVLTSEDPTSLLPIGIIKVEGDFERDDIVQIIDQENNVLGLGKTQYSSEIVKSVVGMKNQKPFIHRHYLFTY